MGKGLADCKSFAVRVKAPAQAPLHTKPWVARSHHPCLTSGTWDGWQARVHLPLIILRLAERSAMPLWVGFSAVWASVLSSLRKTDASLLICFQKRGRIAWQRFWSVSQLQSSPAAPHTSDDPRLELITKAELNQCNLQNVNGRVSYISPKKQLEVWKVSECIKKSSSCRVKKSPTKQTKQE